MGGVGGEWWCFVLTLYFATISKLIVKGKIDVESSIDVKSSSPHPTSTSRKLTPSISSSSIRGYVIYENIFPLAFCFWFTWQFVEQGEPTIAEEGWAHGPGCARYGCAAAQRSWRSSQRRLHDEERRRPTTPLATYSDNCLG